jgi:hypothetical protein
MKEFNATGLGVVKRNIPAAVAGKETPSHSYNNQDTLTEQWVL